MAAKLRPRREHVTALLEDQKFGEPRWLPAAAVLTAAALYVTMPSRFIGSSSVYLAAVRIGIPILALALMAPLALTAPNCVVFRMLNASARSSTRVRPTSGIVF